MAAKKARISKEMKEIKQVERYEYLLVEYLKEISAEITYLLLIICSLFLFVLIDLLPGAQQMEGYYFIKIVFILLIIGGFGLFGLSNVTKRRIERKFEQLLR